MSSPTTIEKSIVRKTPCSPGCRHPQCIPKMKIELPRRCYYPIHLKLDKCRYYTSNVCENLSEEYCYDFGFIYDNNKCQTTSNKCSLSLSVSL